MMGKFPGKPYIRCFFFLWFSGEDFPNKTNPVPLIQRTTAGTRALPWSPANVSELSLAQRHRGQSSVMVAIQHFFSDLILVGKIDIWKKCHVGSFLGTDLTYSEFGSPFDVNSTVLLAASVDEFILSVAHRFGHCTNGTKILGPIFITIFRYY